MDAVTRFIHELTEPEAVQKKNLSDAMFDLAMRANRYWEAQDHAGVNAIAELSERVMRIGRAHGLIVS